MFLRQNRRAGSDTTDDGQGGFVSLGFKARDANAARCARGHLDGALAGQCLEMLFGGVGGLETQFLCDLGTGGRVSVVIQASLDESQDLSLAWRQF